MTRILNILSPRTSRPLEKAPDDKFGRNAKMQRNNTKNLNIVPSEKLGKAILLQTDE